MSKTNEKKRSFQEVHKEEEDSGDGGEPSPVAAHRSNASYKKRRAGTANASIDGPILDRDNNPFL